MEDIIRENHEALIGDHRGRFKTLKRVERLTWKGIKSDIEQFVKFCEECQLRKLIRQRVKQPMVITDTATRAFERVDLDIVGELRPPTKMGNKKILTCQCNRTKYSGAIGLSKVDSANIAKAFAEDFICRFECLSVICTDQGANLISELMHQFTKIFKIK